MRVFTVTCLLVALSGCATVIVPQATGGSRSDGTVELSYQYGGFQVPDIQWDEALTQAIKRCQSWDYRSAEPFGGQISKCQASNDYGCTSWVVTVPYQCTDRIDLND